MYILWYDPGLPRYARSDEYKIKEKAPTREGVRVDSFSSSGRVIV